MMPGKEVWDVGRDTEEAWRRVTSDKHPIDIAPLHLCSHLLHARSAPMGRRPEPNKNVFNLTLKASARLWSGLTKSHFLDLDIQILNVSVLFYWHAVSAHECHSGGG